MNKECKITTVSGEVTYGPTKYEKNVEKETNKEFLYECWQKSI